MNASRSVRDCGHGEVNVQQVANFLCSTSPCPTYTIVIFCRNVGVTGNTSHLFYVEVEDREKVASGGGLQAEGEFIEIIEMSVPDFKAYIDSVDLNSPTGLAVAALWFFANVTV